MYLPNDVTRCPGTTHTDCIGCRRREPAKGPFAPYMTPDYAGLIALGYCAHRIASDPYAVQAVAEGNDG